MRRPGLELRRVGGLRTSESAAAPRFYRSGSTSHNILPVEWTDLLWVRRWTWCSILERLGYGGDRTSKWDALDRCRNGEVGRLGVQRLCISGMWALWPRRRTAAGVFAWDNFWLAVRDHTLLWQLGL